MKTHIGHYEVVAELGRGGMGVVYKGYEPGLARFVAIKELSPALAHDPALVERFLREARSMAALNDPHILQIHFIGEDNGQPFFAMEFVDGESLSSVLLREHRLRVADAMKILLQAAQGLAVAHDRGVIHRDIKPANLLLTQRGQVKIADFGIALANQEFDSKLTGTGQLVGTPGYLSPEVCLGKPVDARSDIFALGIVLFEMLTGRTPFSDESPLKLMLDVVQSEIPDVRSLNEEVDAEVAALMAKMLAKDPAARYQDVHALIADLQIHPLVGQGGALTFKTLPALGAAATQMLPATPGASRPPSPLPGASVTPHVSTRPGQPTPAALTAPGVASTRWPLWAGLVAILVVAGVFAGRGWLLPKPEPIAVAAVTTNTIVTPPVSAPAAAASIAMVAPATVSAPLANVTAPTPPPTTAATVALKPKPAPAVPVASEPAPDEPVFVQIPTLPANLRQQAKFERRAGQHSIAVISEGDSTLSGPAKQMVEQHLRNSGATVVDSPAQADILVRVNAEVLGSQALPFVDGAATTATSAMLTIQAFGAGGRALGPGVHQRIEYTPGDVDDKLSQLVSGSSGRLVELLNRQH
jgi:serine/threonine-protein kinase